ncbi:MAG: hypothetical protein JNL58_31340 [Planctomyces sp.]|nr:hypothetical protein [Planctomyces sp.]
MLVQLSYSLQSNRKTREGPKRREQLLAPRISESPAAVVCRRDGPHHRRLPHHRNWHNVPLETRDVVVQPIGGTTNDTGIEIHGWLDERTCRKGRTVSDRDLAGCCFTRHKFHGEGIMKSIHTDA